MANFIEAFHEEGYYGSLIIEGFQINHDGFDPVAKIWSSIRKVIREKYGIDATGIFTYAEPSTILCRFYLNFGVKPNNPQLYYAKFKETFSMQMQEFCDALITFEEVDDGLKEFNKIAKTAFFEEQDKFLGMFLRKYGFRPTKKQ